MHVLQPTYMFFLILCFSLKKSFEVFLIFFHCVTIVISIIGIFWVVFCSRDFFSAANVTILPGTKSSFICANSWSSTSCHLLFPDSQNLIKTTYQKQIIPFKIFPITIVLLAVFANAKSCWGLRFLACEPLEIEMLRNLSKNYIFFSSSKSSDEMALNISEGLEFSLNLVFSKDSISSVCVRFLPAPTCCWIATLVKCLQLAAFLYFV